MSRYVQYRICDRTGFRVRASDTVKEWTGAIVKRGSEDQRHPQEFVRARREDLRVPDPRPPPVDVYVGPLNTEVTAAASPGAVVVNVLHTERMEAGDRIGIMLADGDLFRTIIAHVFSTTELLLDQRLPGAVAAGGRLINYTAVSTSNPTA